MAEAEREAAPAAFLDVAPTSIYRYVLNEARVAAKMSVWGRFRERRLTQAPSAVFKKLGAVRLLSLFRLAAA